METIGKICLKHHRKGESIREIVRSTGISRNTVRKYLRRNETQAAYEREIIHEPKLGPFETILHKWLVAQEKLPKKERSCGTQLFRDLQTKGYLGA